MTSSPEKKDSSPQKKKKRKIVLATVIAGNVVGTIVARRRGYTGLGGNTVVCCRQGHLFTTIWVPGASVKAVRLGWWRLQRCPVGAHFSLVSPVKVSALTDEEKQLAALHRDIRLP